MNENLGSLKNAYGSSEYTVLFFRDIFLILVIEIFFTHFFAMSQSESFVCVKLNVSVLYLTSTMTFE
jgi:hypothetical protein